MSLPSSPAAFAAAASGSSPPSKQSPSDIMLTPRSKVRALLARFDDSDSDKENKVSPSKRTRPQSTIEKRADPPAAKISARPSESNTDDDAPIVRPKGKMAARMLAGGGPKNSSESDSDGKNAYSRVRKQLTRKAPSKAPVVTKNSSQQRDKDNTSPKGLLSPRPVNGDSTLSPPGDAASPSVQTPVATTRSPARDMSPGLFVTPSKSPEVNAAVNTASAQLSESDEDLPSNPLKNKSFLALVARKRKEIKEQEKLAAERRRAKQNEALSGSEEDDQGEGIKLTQQARPTRKASKKAIEEMHRETQRISRNMQLAHQAKTKKTFRTADLLAKFNYGAKVSDSEQATTANNSGTSVQPSSDIEPAKDNDTPLTSPQSASGSLNLGKSLPGAVVSGARHATSGSEDELPDVGDVLSQPLPKAKSAKTRVVSLPMTAGIDPSSEIDLDSEDDLQILPAKQKSRFPVFDRIPAKKAQESASLMTLRALANLNSPGRFKHKGSAMTSVQLQSVLQKRARLQARIERQDKFDELRARGMIIETAEEREREQEETENLLEQARADAEKLRKLEKAQGKKDGAGSGDENALSASEDEDEDWEESEDEEVEQELCGLEDEVEGDDEEDQVSEAAAEGESMLDQAAEEALESEEEDMSPALTPKQVTEGGLKHISPFSQDAVRRNRNKRVIVDEDDNDDETENPPIQAAPTTPAQDDSALDLGLGPPSSAPLGLTQMFAGTMADNDEFEGETRELTSQAGPQMSLDFLRDMPVASPPAYTNIMGDISQDPLIYDSQPGHLQQPGETTLESHTALRLTQVILPTQASEMPDPTQDEGFANPRLEMGTQARPTSTADTVPIQVLDSPAVQRKGRLRRRKDAVAAFSDSDRDGEDFNDALSDDEDSTMKTNAFQTMLKTSKKLKAQQAFDKKRSHAREIVEEQAQESEDEYAGLGGASDDDSNADMDDFDVEMIDDEGNFKGDERKLAAFYAGKERADNEKLVDKLYRDITSGALRRKRGADFELSDSEDDEQERRRRKQREFARMRKALLEDEKIEKIAENPKKQAFLRAIEDRDSDSDVDFLDEPKEGAASTTAATQILHSQDAAAEAGSGAQHVPSVRTTSRDSGMNDENRPPGPHASKNPRRTAAHLARRPATLAEVRETLSFLVEDSFIPESHLSDSDHSDQNDSKARGEQQGSNAANHTPRPVSAIAPRRASTNGIVNRLSLARGVAVSAAAQQLSRCGMAFHTTASGSGTGTTGGGAAFKTPAMLLRRATTGGVSTASTSTSTSSTTNTSEGGASSSVNFNFKKPALRHAESLSSSFSSGSGVSGVGIGGVRMGGSKKSNIHYQAREVERRAKMDGAERRRRDGVRKAALKGAKRSTVIGFLEREGSWV